MPFVADHLVVPWEMFWLLHSQRTSSMSLNPILVSDIIAALKLFHIRRDEHMRHVRLLVAMDIAYLRHMQQSTTKNANTSTRG